MASKVCVVWLFFLLSISVNHTVTTRVCFLTHWRFPTLWLWTAALRNILQFMVIFPHSQIICQVIIVLQCWHARVEKISHRHIDDLGDFLELKRYFLLSSNRTILCVSYPNLNLKNPNHTLAHFIGEENAPQFSYHTVLVKTCGITACTHIHT